MLRNIEKAATAPAGREENVEPEHTALGAEVHTGKGRSDRILIGFDRYRRFLVFQLLKKKERENEHEMERLAREKIAAQQRLASLKKELGVQWDNIEYNNLISDPPQPITTPVVSIKEEHPVVVTTRSNDDIQTVVPRVTNPIQSTQLNLTVPFSQVVTQGLVVGLHKVALVSKPLPLVSSPVAHIITAPPQLNGKVTLPESPSRRSIA